MISISYYRDHQRTKFNSVVSPAPLEPDNRRGPGLVHRISGLSGFSGQSLESAQFLHVDNENVHRFTPNTSPVHFDHTDGRRGLVKRFSGLSESSQYLSVDNNDGLRSRLSNNPSPLHFDSETADKIRSKGHPLTRRFSESSQFLNVDNLSKMSSPNPSPLHFDMELNDNYKIRKNHTLTKRLSGGLDSQQYIHIDSNENIHVSPNPSPVPHHDLHDDKIRKGHSIVRKISGVSEASHYLHVADLSPPSASRSRLSQYSGYRGSISSPRGEALHIAPLNASFNSGTGKLIPTSPSQMSPNEKKTLDRTIHSLLH